MRILHFGHSCVLLELPTSVDRVVRILIDPGNFATGLDQVGDLDAVLITHDHIDHLDLAQVDLVLAAGSAGSAVPQAFAGYGAAAALRNHGIAVTDLDGHEEFTVGGITVRAVPAEHPPLHTDLPCPNNYAYLIDGSILHPGDSWVRVAEPVEVLLLAIAGPWMRLADAVDYQRSIKPRLSVAIHEGGLAQVHRDLHAAVLRRLAPTATTVVVPEPGKPIELVTNTIGG